MSLGKNINSYIPKALKLQWHITERCNLRCSHCYQESYSGAELNFDELVKILKQFKSLLYKWRDTIKAPLRGHITITGGEPFIRDDFFDLLSIFSENKKYFSFSILSNGTLINKKNVLLLKKLSPAYIQVSIEGGEDTHNKIRGKNSFEQTISCLKLLKKNSIKTMISFTAHNDNFHEFPQVVKTGKKLGVSKIWADRLIPNGSGALLENQLLSANKTREFFILMNKYKKKSSLFSKTEVSMNRALQFLIGGGKPYKCSAGKSLITVLPNGDLLPCRRMDVKVGNLMEQPLEELYYESDFFQKLRDPNQTIEGCENCFYSKLCMGGLKCLSYAINKTPFKADPGCWIKQN